MTALKLVALITAGTLIVLTAGGALEAASAAATQRPRASLTDIENDVMCVSCREPLAVAQSPQAIAEREYIRSLIAQGLTKRQIEQNLVVQYGAAVLGKPPASGFNLSVYILPPAILAVGLAILAIALPRWRRRSRAAAAASSASGPPLDPAEADRLERELSQFRG
ncbi:MAG: cytochrome c-type biogenesis protein CcmH [Solirubrobacterales bacterium]|nr:cytochrome c-type biogenesis protein CcmH [Solirubrobacterales bacterium]